MHIQSPPRSDSGLEKILRFSVEYLNNYFQDHDFDSRYFSQFAWFRNSIVEIETILNIGCGRGRESFALMWQLGARRVVGIDKNPRRIEEADITLGNIRNLSGQSVDRILGMRSLPAEFVERLRNWYESEVPVELKQQLIPEFLKLDISEQTPQSIIEHYDLIYCRYVLDKLVQPSDTALASAAKNIARFTRPGIGRVVVVVPTEVNGMAYDVTPFLINAGLQLLKTVEERRLGHLESPKSKPRGYIFVKPEDKN